MDKQIQKELPMRDNTLPLLALALGYPNENQNARLPLEIGDKLPNCVEETAIFPTDDFFIANAFSGKESSCGTSTSSTEAEFKACMEMIERKYPRFVKADRICTMEELDGPHLDLSVFIPKDKQRSYGKIAWKKVPLNDDPARTIYVPSDFIYYGFDRYPEEFGDVDRIYHANSSGISAHTDEEEAEKNAILELIERDAIMRTWFSQKQPPLVNKKCLPLHVKRRINELREAGRKTRVHLLPSRYATVVQVEIIGKYPAFVCGAAADLDMGPIGVERAIKKALAEAESQLYFAERNAPRTIAKQNAMTPEDHAIYYYQEDNLGEISWLWGGKEKTAMLEDKGGYNLPSLKDVLNIITIDIDCDETVGPNADKVYIKRAISPELIPMEFGFNGYYLSDHKSVTNVNLSYINHLHYFS